MPLNPNSFFSFEEEKKRSDLIRRFLRRLLSMSATVASETKAVLCTESLPATKAEAESECVECHCCGLTEECTPAYVANVRERYHGRWICGLCSEAVKDEICRSERLIGMEEAMNLHMSFCKKFRSADPSESMLHLISAMRQLMRRSFDSPRAPRSTPNSPQRKEESGQKLPRTESCFSALKR